MDARDHRHYYRTQSECPASLPGRSTGRPIPSPNVGNVRLLDGKQEVALSRYSVRRIAVSVAVAVTASAAVVAGPSVAQAQPALFDLLAGASTGSTGSAGDTPDDAKTHSGDATYFHPGLGSCGGRSADTDYVVAISARIWTRALCGKQILASSGPRSVTVTIVDTCPGCAAGDLDFSPAAFKKLGNLSDGRIPVTWKFIG